MGFWKTFLGFDPNRKRLFPGAQEGEEVIYMGVSHWTSLIPFFVKMALFSTVLVLLNVFDVFGIYSSTSGFFINSISVALLFHFLCFRLYNYFLKVMMITNYRLIDIRHTVFLRREREVIPMTNIQDLRFQQNGIFARMFKYGELIVLGSSSDVKYSFHRVPQVNRLHHILGEIHQKALRDTQRSIQKNKDFTPNS